MHYFQHYWMDLSKTLLLHVMLNLNLNHVLCKLTWTLYDFLLTSLRNLFVIHVIDFIQRRASAHIATPFHYPAFLVLLVLLIRKDPQIFGEFNDTARGILVHVPNPAIAATLTLVLNADKVQPPLGAFTLCCRDSTVSCCLWKRGRR